MEAGRQVQPLNLQLEVLDGVEASGAPGHVLVSQGAGTAPVWASPASVPGPGRGLAYQQVVPAAVWEIEHDFIWNPAVSVMDDSREQVDCAVSYPSGGLVRLEFNWPVSGFAWLT